MLVKVVSDPEEAKLISDPMRRAILNLVRQRALTEAELAERLGLTDGTVNYHLGLLRKNGFLKVARTEPEEHGILQKFYAPTAFLYIPDVEALPKEVARYYYPVNIERIRGVLSADKKKASRLDLASNDVDELGEDLAKELVKVARRYKGRKVVNDEGEGLVAEIYEDAISNLFHNR